MRFRDLPTQTIAIWIAAFGVLAFLGGGCASSVHDGTSRRAQGFVRVTRTEIDAIRDPQSPVVYAKRATDRLSARPSDYGALAEQGQEGAEQAGHWLDAVLGRPERRGVGPKALP